MLRMCNKVVYIGFSMVFSCPERVRERKRGRGRQTDRQTDRQRARENGVEYSDLVIQSGKINENNPRIVFKAF